MQTKMLERLLRTDDRWPEELRWSERLDEHAALNPILRKAGVELMTRSKIVIALIAVALVVILSLQNTAGVDARILFYSGNVPLAVLLLVSFAAGVRPGCWLRSRSAVEERSPRTT